MTDNAPNTFKIDAKDLTALEQSKMNRKLALAEAQTALTKSENAELTYQNLILQIYLKYGLDPRDSLNVDTGVVTPKEDPKETPPVIVGDSNDF